MSCSESLKFLKEILGIEDPAVYFVLAVSKFSRKRLLIGRKRLLIDRNLSLLTRDI